MRHTTFIYALIDPFNREVRYVGKSNDPARRFHDHCSLDGSNPHKDAWLRSVLHRGRLPYMRVIEECYQDAWQERERFWIAHYRAAGRLTNILDGGDGGPDLPPDKKQMLDLKLAKMIYSGPDGLRTRLERAGKSVGRRDGNRNGRDGHQTEES